MNATFEHVVFYVVLIGVSGCRQKAASVKTPLPVSAPANGIRMRDMTAASGVHFAYDSGQSAGLYTIVESLGGGVGLFDYDNDGRHDIFFPGGGSFNERKEPSGRSSAFFRNLGNWHFTEVTQTTNLGLAPYYSHGCAAADFDNDGFADLAVSGYGGLQLFHNQGDGTFEEVSRIAGFADRCWSTSLAWGDLNGDSCLDLYISHYIDWSPDNDPRCTTTDHQREVCSPRSFSSVPDVVYYNDGEGAFLDATQQANLRAGQGDGGKGLGVLTADLDHDGDLDVYVANDTEDNYLYVNDGNGAFDEVGLLHGAARSEHGIPEGSMGIALGDFDLDGLPDLCVTDFVGEIPSLYHNDGQACFHHASRAAGIARMGNHHLGFGVLFADLDRDGDEDLVIANGHVFRAPTGSSVRQKPWLLVNDHGQFENSAQSVGGYFSDYHLGRGVASSDLDDDGDLDLVFSHGDGEVNSLVANEAPSGGVWLRVRLIGTRSNRSAIGAWLMLHTSSGAQLRHIVGGGSYLSQSDLRPFWGVPPGDRITGLSIHWPGPATQDYPVNESNRELTIIEPHGRASQRSADDNAD